MIILIGQSITQETLKTGGQSRGADGITDNIDLIGDTPVPVFADETDYAVSDLVTHKSNAERLGSDAANALNGLLQGLNDGLEASDDEYENCMY